MRTYKKHQVHTSIKYKYQVHSAYTHQVPTHTYTSRHTSSTYTNTFIHKQLHVEDMVPFGDEGDILQRCKLRMNFTDGTRSITCMWWLMVAKGRWVHGGAAEFKVHHHTDRSLHHKMIACKLWVHWTIGHVCLFYVSDATIRRSGLALLTFFVGLLTSS